jgi:hypothetical protein
MMYLGYNGRELSGAEASNPLIAFAIASPYAVILYVVIVVVRGIRSVRRNQPCLPSADDTARQTSARLAVEISSSKQYRSESNADVS